MEIKMNKPHFCILCMICDEPVELKEFEQKALDRGLSIAPRVCTKCKAAVMRIRKEMEDET